MPCNCHEGGFTIIENLSTVALIINLLMIGITNSFTHCIGMCGSIAMSQATMRLLSVTQKSHWKKIKSCIAWEYYLGKTIAYSIITCVAIFVSKAFKDIPIFLVAKNIMLSIAVLYFIYLGMKTTFSILNIKLPAKKPGEIKINTSTFFSKIIKKLINSHNVFIKLFIGILLGFIPCGAVYAAIAVIVDNTGNFFTGIAGSLAFGLGTFPGLFLISFSGTMIFYRFKKIFDIIYVVMMLWNAYLLMKNII